MVAGGGGVSKIEPYLSDGTTPRCPAVGVTGQCQRAEDKYGHLKGPHDPPDAVYVWTAHPASFWNEE